MARGGQATQFPPVRYAVTKLGAAAGPGGVTTPGGLDLTTPSLALQPGALRACLNFECSQAGGYSRIGGYERYDGRAAPSAATYQIIQVTSFTNVPTVGQTITQAVSGATGQIIAINNAAGAYYMAVTKVTGTFDDSNAITTPGPTAIGTATAITIAISSQTNAQYLAQAADVYRALIGAVPGSGSVTGVVGMIFSGLDCLYAFRPNVGNTAVELYKATATGWTLIPFYNTVTFTVGDKVGAPVTYQPPDGAILTQGGVTATIKRVMWASGLFSGGSATGTFVVTNPSGGNFAAGAATLSDGSTVTLGGIQTAITLAPGGRFEFVKCNFSGQLVTRRIYGCDGVNKCFEFDGDTLAPISTGLTLDQPSHIMFHKNYLFISQASSIFHCGPGTPFKWGGVDGGGEIATGDVVTGMVSLPGSQSTATLGVFLRSNTAFLYGTQPSDFNYVMFNTGLGALPYSVQNLFDTFFFDNLGIVTLKTTLNWGNFLPSTLSKAILPFIIQQRDKITASSIMREKSQYRVFFSDGYGLWVTTVNQQFLGAGVVQFPNPVFCCDEGALSNGSEVTYFGSNDGNGYVYQMDSGTSFDGEDINAYVTMAWDAIKTPRILKRFRAASIEIQGGAYAQVNFGYQLGYGSTLIGQPNFVPYATGFAGAPNWDTFTWDNFVWDGQTLAPTDVDMTGTAENVQVTISSGTNYIGAYTLDSIIYQYTLRRGLRV
jgi:hypothetical protein